MPRILYFVTLKKSNKDDVYCNSITNDNQTDFSHLTNFIKSEMYFNLLIPESNSDKYLTNVTNFIFYGKFYKNFVNRDEMYQNFRFF